MPASLAETQLKSALTNEQIVAARTKGLAVGDADPVAEEIATALAKVDTYAAGYEVEAGLLTGWARDIAAHAVAKRLGSATEDQIRAWERANKELEDLRDGKFANIPRTTTPPVTGRVAHGTRTKVL